MTEGKTIEYSLILPVFNEEKYLISQMRILDKYCRLYLKSYEILLVENGSTDKTYEMAVSLSKDYPALLVLKLAKPSYGGAVNKGIGLARGKYIIQLDIDFIDKGFLKICGSLMGQTDILVGSKLLRQSNDGRHHFRVFISYVINYMIRRTFRYSGTDTHGIKVYRKDKIFPLLRLVKTRYHFYDTELILLAVKHGINIREVPVSLTTLRPSRFPVPIRIWQAAIEFISLAARRKDLTP